MRRWLLILGPAVVLVAIMTVMAQLAKPRVESWVLTNLESFSRANLPVVMTAQAFRFEYFLPQAELIGLQIQAKAELDLGPMKFDIDRATAKLDLLQILAGRVRLSGVTIEGFGTDVDLDPFLVSKDEPKPIDWAPIFRALKKIPVSRLALQSASMHVSSSKHNLEADLIEFDMLILNERERLQIRLDLQDADLVWGDLASPLRLQADASLSPQGLDVTDLRLLGLGSLVRATASFTNLPYLLMAPEGSAQWEVKAALPQIGQLLKKIKSAPQLEGNVEMKGQLELAQGSMVSGGFRLFGSGLKVDQFQIGQVETEGRLLNDTIQVDKVLLTNDAGLADVRDIELNLIRQNDAFKGVELKAKIQAEAIDLHELLLKLGVGDLPLEAFVTTKVTCAGPLYPDLLIECEGTAQGDQLEVRSGEGLEKTILQIDNFEADGRFAIDLEKIAYETKLKIGQDAGTSSGVIHYESGFEIQFATPRLNFKNVPHLSGLKLEGSARINGKTAGHSRSAHFQLQAEGQDIYFENFFLGQLRTGLRYDRGLLYFENVSGVVGATSYSGTVALDLERNRLKVSAKSDRADLVDITQILERRIKIPIELTGSGIGNIELEGPLEINKLTYQGKAQFSKVSAANENFDLVDVQVSSNVGKFKFDRALASKGKHQIEMSGTGHPSGEIDFLVKGTELPLEQSENISRLGSNISGLLNFQMGITGQLSSPNLLLTANIQNLIVDEKELPDTLADVKINSLAMEGTASMVGGKLTSKFKFPFNESENFRLNVDAEDWNFTSLFTLLGAGNLISEYQASLTGTIDLFAERGGFWNSSGKSTIARVFLKRGTLSLENPRPIQITARDGSFALENFLLTGSGARLEVATAGSSRDRLEATVKVEAELRLFQIFLPFLEEFSGKARASVTVGGGIFKPEILGSAQTQAAFVKAKGFGHPFEKIDADVQFSQSKVLISSAKGELGGGTFSADGHVTINGVRDIPTQIRAQVNGVTLNVPDRVRTTGSGDLTLSGSWFPFTLSGVYRVQSGFVDKELGGDGLSNEIRQSSYLPKIILQRAFEPLLLDLQILINQPLTIQNSMVDGTITGQIQVKGPPGSPLLFGGITGERGTKLLFRDKTFDVSSANIRFNDPKELNPELYVSASARVKEYDVNLLVQGTAKNPVIRTSSTPPLSEQDIVSLLALGVTSADVDKRLAQKDQEQSGQFQVGTALLQQFEPVKKFQKAAGINVQYSSAYDNTRNVEVRKFTVTKQLSEKTKISVAFPPDQQPDEYRFEYSLSPNVSAIGTFEQKNRADQQSIQEVQETESILGLDLEFRREFR
jgi:translocation and assembly module TamB